MTRMRKNKQLVVSKGNGDCFRACMTSILGVPNTDAFPNVHGVTWFRTWKKVLSRFGLSISYYGSGGPIWRDGYWIASVKSRNFEGVTHAIIMKGDEVAYDPSTKKRYRKGKPLVGKGIVVGGYSIELNDASKLHNLVKLIPPASGGE